MLPLCHLTLLTCFARANLQQWELPKELKDLKQKLEDDEKEAQEEAEGDDRADSENG
jgi:hypothetical protein